MDKALRMGKTSATGSFQLFIGNAASTIILAIGTIIFVRLMSPDEYGLYSIALIPSLTISLFRDWGIGNAMTKYIVQFRASNEFEEVNDIIATGLIFEIATGLALSLVSLFTASFVASTILHRPELPPLISIVSITIFSNALLTAAQSSFIGYERMELNSYTMLAQAIVKSLVTPCLVFLGYGALGATLGYTFSFLVAGIMGLILLYYFVFARDLRRTKTSRLQIFKTLKKMLHYGVPLSISTLLLGFMGQFYGFMMVYSCSDIMIGNYQSAIQFAIILTFITSPISTVLFPAFTKPDPQKEHQLLETIFASSVKYTALLLIPATLAMMILSKPMINTLFGEKWIYAPFFLTLYVMGNLFSVIGNLSLSSFLTGRGETKMLMKLSFLILLFGIPLAFLLIPTFGIVGVILGNLLAGLPSMFWGLHWIWKRYNVKADFRSSTKIFIAASIAAITTYVLLHFVTTTEWLRLTTGGIFFLAVYLIVVPLMGAITQDDINNLKAMFSGLGVISKIIEIPLSLMERFSSLRSARRKLE
jgi:O-antigen/teichoic acid export membrane protein